MIKMMEIFLYIVWIITVFQAMSQVKIYNYVWLIITWILIIIVANNYSNLII